MDGIEADGIDVVEGGGDGDDTFDIGGAGFKFEGEVVVGGV